MAKLTEISKPKRHMSGTPTEGNFLRRAVAEAVHNPIVVSHSVEIYRAGDCLLIPGRCFRCWTSYSLRYVILVKYKRLSKLYKLFFEVTTRVFVALPQIALAGFSVTLIGPISSSVETGVETGNSFINWVNAAQKFVPASSLG